MQEKFIQQYKYFDELINRCYPGSMITLDFSIDSLLTFFSDIAQSHWLQFCKYSTLIGDAGTEERGGGGGGVE
jgi:hypothetical protein